MQEIDFYKAIAIMRKQVVPFTVVFTELSLKNNEGGPIHTLSNQLVGPLRKNMNAKYMIGLADEKTKEIRHIYMHTILQLALGTGEHYKLVLQ
jgi:hypothetical protein